MKRGRWVSFNEAITNAEFRSVPQPDRGALFYAMKQYGDGLEVGFTTKAYGDGLYMIKARGGRSGRCLFFFFEDEGDARVIVALLAYKKESQDAPSHLVSTARERMNRYQDEK